MRFFRRPLLYCALALLCACRNAAVFPVRGSSAVLYGRSREAAEGTISLSRPKKISYEFSRPLALHPASSLELEYDLGGASPQDIKNFPGAVLEISGGDSWVLPWDASFLGLENSGPFRYAVPLPPLELEGFSLILGGPEDGKHPAGSRDPVLRIRSVGITPRRYGFSLTGTGLFATPFVYRREPSGGEPGGAFVIEPFGPFRMAGAELVVSSASAPVRIGAGDRLFTASADAFVIPPGALFPVPRLLTIEGGEPFSIILAEAEIPPPSGSIPADPGIILEYPQDAWRDERYELFHWDRFPGILIFDTGDYALQDRFFKRLAFFVEKAGFRGRLAPDGEIAALHGWNAHDYRAEDLARFFGRAAAEDFPLLPEERELERILLAEGVIRKDGPEYAAGEGALVSVSRESSPGLRALFMAHECFHGLFFVDRDFREFSRRRWDAFSPGEKKFILSYFDYQHYDINDEYLVLNEFMAHCLQQPASQAFRYFGETLASRIDASSWRRGVLPAKDEASGSWPELGRAFRAEAEAFSEYVNRRWGLSAGRVWTIRVE